MQCWRRSLKRARSSRRRRDPPRAVAEQRLLRRRGRIGRWRHSSSSSNNSIQLVCHQRTGLPSCTMEIILRVHHDEAAIAPAVVDGRLRLCFALLSLLSQQWQVLAPFLRRLLWLSPDPGRRKQRRRRRRWLEMPSTAALLQLRCCFLLVFLPGRPAEESCRGSASALASSLAALLQK